jgi:dTDP-4-dehydrorhamnose 3,5-epimerase
MIRSDQPTFRAIGEVYFSEIRPGVVKAWKRHSSMTQRVTVPVGRVRFVVFDPREGSATRGALAEYILGRPDCYRLLVIPPGVWYGFQGIADGPSIVANCTDLPHDPAESETRPINDGPVAYEW